MMSFKKIFKKVILGVSVIVFCSCEHKGNSKKNQYQFTQIIDSVMVESYKRGLLNGNVLVVKNDKVVYQNSFGFTNQTQERELDEKSIFNTGSIAKQFNGVAIMMLQEKGLLNIHDTISKFDLGLPNWSKKVTINHLLNYVSGIPRIDPIAPPNDNEAWKILRSVDTLLFEPGTNFGYDNSNVFLQRRIIEKVTGQSFQEFVTDNIITPLGMTNVVFDPKLDYPNRTSCYDYQNVQCPEMQFISGWLWLDINELYKWVKALNSNTLITQESFNTLLKNPYIKGMGSSLGEYFENKQLHRYNGTSIKFRSMLLNDFKNDLIIILLSNNGGLALELGHTIHNVMLEKDFEVPKQSIRTVLQNDFMSSVDEGINAYYKLKQSSKSHIYNFKSPVELNRLCIDAYRQDISIEESIKVFKFAVSEFPEDVILLGNLGEMYFEYKAYDLALKTFKKVLTIDADNSKAERKIKEINAIINLAN